MKRATGMSKSSISCCMQMSISARASAGWWLGLPAIRARLLLAEAKNDVELSRVGDQTGGRVFLFLETDDFEHDHEAMMNRGVAFKEEPRREAYGTVAVFADLYGNLWDLIEPKG
jgi:hypothetical protein